MPPTPSECAHSTVFCSHLFRRDSVCRGRATQRYVGFGFLGLQKSNLKAIKAQCHAKSVTQAVLDFPMELLYKDQAAFNANENTQRITLLQERQASLRADFMSVLEMLVE